MQFSSKKHVFIIIWEDSDGLQWFMGGLRTFRDKPRCLKGELERFFISPTFLDPGKSQNRRKNLSKNRKKRNFPLKNMYLSSFGKNMMVYSGLWAVYALFVINRIGSGVALIVFIGPNIIGPSKFTISK